MDLDLFVKYNTLDPIISKLQPKVILFFYYHMTECVRGINKFNL